MNAQTSLGSQFQYDDHAWWAQIGPVISTAKVHTGKREGVQPVGHPVQGGGRGHPGEVAGGGVGAPAP